MKRYVKIFVEIFGKGINFTKSRINTAVYFSDFFLTLIFCMHFLACMWVWIGTTLDYSWIDGVTQWLGGGSLTNGFGV
jgi:hypothetical protein